MSPTDSVAVAPPPLAPSDWTVRRPMPAGAVRVRPRVHCRTAVLPGAGHPLDRQDLAPPGLRTHAESQVKFRIAHHRRQLSGRSLAHPPLGPLEPSGPVHRSPRAFVVEPPRAGRDGHLLPAVHFSEVRSAIGHEKRTEGPTASVAATRCLRRQASGIERATLRSLAGTHQRSRVPLPGGTLKRTDRIRMTAGAVHLRPRGASLPGTGRPTNAPAPAPRPAARPPRPPRRNTGTAASAVPPPQRAAAKPQPPPPPRAPPASAAPPAAVPPGGRAAPAPPRPTDRAAHTSPAPASTTSARRPYRPADRLRALQSVQPHPQRAPPARLPPAPPLRAARRRATGRPAPPGLTAPSPEPGPRRLRPRSRRRAAGQRAAARSESPKAADREAASPPRPWRAQAAGAPGRRPAGRSPLPAGGRSAHPLRGARHSPLTAQRLL